MDVALATGTPFAVVPCCVFPRLFPDRRQPDGTPVVSYGDFVAFLRAKHPAIEVAWLPFRGKNKVLYWRGPGG